MIEMKAVEKRYGATSALAGFDFRAEDGMITGLLGPNGAGKTTALHCLCGLVRPDAGQIGVDGMNPATDPVDVRRHLGLVPDRAGNYPRLSVREHLEYFGGLQGLTPSDRAAAIDRVVAELELGSIIDRRAEGFSQGQRVKLNLAIALLHRPRNLVLDEPGLGLDVMSTRALRQVLMGLREHGHCILFSSHVMQEVAALCDRIVVQVAGRNVATGSPEELCDLAGEPLLEDAFVRLAGEEGIAA
ncbi:ATP-binding cassette domain-containing protein [Wenzhouxiangella sp. AB-CW3]|uniref:ABC transporter ATP-binding protein n=1 Tax=Wenzhouxiangella sp. AB-CW3 TaxID=2771012 RepID=UPI00168C066C|nr:ATP-binding cassette domain-containing protein [Wenzhouxiangella sp. AB-CW3]QOC21960.1 ATP-binding cassette domain-containing protein [Wenzhouxiangella sp. AB-CW3]